MKLRFSPKHLLFFLPLLLGLAVTGCETNNCQEVICAPCPSSRFVIQYVDSTGQCISPSTPDGMIYAFMQGNTSDTLYSYSFNDSCTASFIIEKNMMYHVKAGTDIDHTVRIDGFTFQEPIWATECCACYPVDSLSVNTDGVTDETIVFPASSYENDPYTYTVN